MIRQTLQTGSPRGAGGYHSPASHLAQHQALAEYGARLGAASQPGLGTHAATHWALGIMPHDAHASSRTVHHASCRTVRLTASRASARRWPGACDLLLSRAA